MRDLDRFYELLAELEERLRGKKLLTEYGQWNRHLDRPGIHFWFEPGEYRRAAAEALRVVHVGMSDDLSSHLNNHYGTDRGEGHHRNAVLRKHVGFAIMRKHGNTHEVPSWGKTRPPSEPQQRRAELDLEAAVSRHVRAMSVLWIFADGQCDSSEIKRHAVALISNHTKPHDPPSSGWLGRSSKSPKIRSSGLWNVYHVCEDYDPGFLDLFGKYVSATKA